MYHILHIPTNQFIYRQYLTDDNTTSREIDMQFYTANDAEKHLRKLMALIGAYNLSLKRIKGANRGILNFKRYRKYTSTKNILEQGFVDKWGMVIKRNNVTFYGDVLPLLHISNITADFHTRINISRAEFLIIKECL